MSLHPHIIAPVPEETVRIARAAFPSGTPSMTLRDVRGPIFEDQDFRALFPNNGQPGLSPWRLALVTIMPCRENLPDRQAAEAVRARIAWKYLLGLELTDPGGDFSVLSELRDRLLAGSAEELLLDTLLERCQALDLLKARGQQRTDATHVLAALRVLTRFALVAETLRAARNAIATLAPAWLQGLAPLAWYERYGKRMEETRLPREQAKRETCIQTGGEDGFPLLDALEAADIPPALRDLPHRATLRQTWHHHYERLANTATSTGHPAVPRVRFTTQEALPRAGEAIQSPYDPEARYHRKRTTSWVGYTVHMSETCEPTTPHLLTHVHTTTAAVHEAMCTADIHQALVDKDVAPGEHGVDAAYLDAALLVRSQEDHDMTLRGPARPNPPWQAKVAGAYTVADVTVDWTQQQVHCPQGRTSARWTERLDATGNPCIQVRFSQHDCGGCAARPLGTQAKQAARTLKLQPQAHFEAWHAARAWYASAEGQEG